MKEWETHPGAGPGNRPVRGHQATEDSAQFARSGAELRSLSMEEWRQCGRWLIDCKVLPPNHRVVWPSAAVFDLAQALRDGVLLCQMLHNLSPGSVDLKEINFRPQMSQVSRPQISKPKNLRNDAPSLCLGALQVARCVTDCFVFSFCLTCLCIADPSIS